METINNIELKDANIYPDEIVLSKVLGQSYAAYQNLLELFAKHQMNYEWRYYNDGKVWLCKVQKRIKRSFGCPPGKALCRQQFIFS